MGGFLWRHDIAITADKARPWASLEWFELSFPNLKWKKQSIIPFLKTKNNFFLNIDIVLYPINNYLSLSLSLCIYIYICHLQGFFWTSFLLPKTSASYEIMFFIFNHIHTTSLFISIISLILFLKCSFGLFVCEKC